MDRTINFDEITKSIVNNIQVGLYIYHLEKIDDDHTLTMIFANKAAEIFTGVSAENQIGKTLDQNFPGLREKGIPQKYAEVVRSQTPVELEDVYYDQHEIIHGWFAVKAFPLPHSCVGVSFDNITDKKAAEAEKEEVINDLRKAIEEIESLRGIIPLCSYCKKIRDDEGYWERVDIYIRKCLKTDISHSICPNCLKKNFPEEYAAMYPENNTE